MILKARLYAEAAAGEVSMESTSAQSNAKRLMTRLNFLLNRNVPHDRYVVESFWITGCRHRTICETSTTCTTRSDMQRPGLRAYYNQKWMSEQYCPRCYTQIESPLYAYEIFPKPRTHRPGKVSSEIFVIPCRECDVSLQVYQPVLSVNPTKLRERLERAERKKLKGKQNSGKRRSKTVKV